MSLSSDNSRRIAPSPPREKTAGAVRAAQRRQLALVCRKDPDRAQSGNPLTPCADGTSRHSIVAINRIELPLGDYDGVWMPNLDLMAALVSRNPMFTRKRLPAIRLLARIPDVPRVRLRDLRHGHATQLLLAVVHPKIAQERLGHATITTTLDLYSHVTDTMQGDAAARLDAAFGSAIARITGTTKCFGSKLCRN
jgi:hypothetical protein